MLQVQKADEEDPWFQQEWGEIMLQQGRLREAVMHLSVAATLFASQINKVVFEYCVTILCCAPVHACLYGTMYTV